MEWFYDMPVGVDDQAFAQMVRTGLENGVALPPNGGTDEIKVTLDVRIARSGLLVVSCQDAMHKPMTDLSHKQCKACKAYVNDIVSLATRESQSN
jgi:hypothetical protein